MLKQKQKTKKRMTAKRRRMQFKRAVYFLGMSLVISSQVIYSFGLLACKEIESNGAREIVNFFPTVQKVEAKSAPIFEPETLKDFSLLYEDAGNYDVKMPFLAGSLAVKNNNPCNLTYAKQPNSTKAGKFAKFGTKEQGARACLKQVQLDASRGLTLAQFINKFAPSHENNTKLYLSFLMEKLQAGADTKLNQLNTFAIVQAVAMFESQSIINLIIK